MRDVGAEVALTRDHQREIAPRAQPHAFGKLGDREAILLGFTELDESTQERAVVATENAVRSDLEEPAARQR